MRGQGREPVLPFNPAPYLTDWLLEIGPAAPGGESAFGFHEMVAWSHLIGVHLSPWEARTLRRLSRAFVNQAAEARDPACMEPRLKADQDSARKRVDEQFAGLIAAFGQRPRQREV
ncbi:hypothetical protein WBP07_12880 [Novosphingobium sp. BL-8A]|uniref:hypothetical protein n=1 Tax=Novosphingobium sp. BL-8A TaxID=3127639 RepID=UPI003757EA09